MNDVDDAAYELFAVPTGAGEAPLRPIGRYPTYDEALRARDEDVLDELARRGGWYTVIEHVIVDRASRGREPCTGTQPRSGWTRRPGGSQAPTTSMTPDAG